MNVRRLLISTALIVLFAGAVCSQGMINRQPATKLLLHNGWRIQSSAQAAEKGDDISTGDFDASKWYPATVPSTVVGNLVADKIYPDPLFDKNLRLMPGCEYPIGANFSNLEMPANSPFRSSWWYRTEFYVPANYRGKNIWLTFAGINFRANIWLDGIQIANSSQVAGTFRIHEFDISGLARVGQLNTLAVEVFPPQPGDLAWTWVDWNPMPPDKNMGIFREVFLSTSGPVALRYPQVVTHFDLPALETAHLTVYAEAHNGTDRSISGTLRIHLAGVVAAQKVALAPKETKSVSFTPADYPQLNVIHPRIWWPLHMGQPILQELRTQFETEGRISDRTSTRFGIREVTSELDARNHRVFKVNGRNVLIRGGGWASDIFLRYSMERLKAEFDYVKDMNLNAIRLEGQLQPDSFFDLADEYGILVMAGWCCCSHWEHWQHRSDYPEGPVWDKEDYEIAAASQADQIRRLGRHPSLLVWLNGSDNPPPPDVEQMYLDVMKRYHWPNPFLSSATAKPTTVTGPSGVKMEGPYEWVPSSYWMLDKKLGGAHGFATEISPGPAVPPIESLKKMLPEEHLWPINEFWSYHSGGGQFKELKVFTAALNARYGPATDAANYAMKSQLMAYEGQRAMFEAFAGNRYESTGVIQWMLNNAWPSMIWHLYDFYLMPGGGYFGTKKACEPVHAQYSYSDKSVIAVNTTPVPQPGLKLTAEILDISLKSRFSKTVSVDLAPDSNSQAFVLPQIPELSATYFLRLQLQDRNAQTVSSNFYWLSTKDDQLDWQKSTWYYTPTTSYADMTGLERLPPARLMATARAERTADKQTTRVAISNSGNTIAFFVHLQIKDTRTNQNVLPVTWQDNYFSLLPGEHKNLTVTYTSHIPAYLSLEGWNSSPVRVPITTNRKR